MRAASILLLALPMLLLSACGSESPSPEPQPKPVSEPPVAGTLVFPENLSECTEGEIVSDLQSRIQFQWTSGTNTDSFTLEVVDLTANSKNTINTENTEAILTLTRGNQFSWKVISRNDGSAETATTPTWYFYNAGAAVANFAPFPAELTLPVSGTVKNSGPITFYWKGSDLDEDPLSYHVLLDNLNPPVSEVGTTSNENFTTVINDTGIYYWRVKTTDALGNSSLSDISEFRIQ